MMNKYREAIIAVSILALVVLALLVYLFISLIFVYHPIDRYPDSGLWFCKEIGLCLSFEADEMSYLETDEGETPCVIQHIPGRKDLSVYLGVDPISYEGEWLYHKGEVVCDLS